MNNSIFIFCMVLMLSCFANNTHAYGKSLLIDDIFISTEKHFPTIVAAQEKIQETRGLQQEALGGFDMRLDAESKMRASGFYDGDYADARIVKPLQFLNAEVYSGYRQSSGIFPVYEAKNVTQDDGELRAGIMFSLLRDRDIDARRFKMNDARYNVLINEINALYKNIEVKLMAQHRYAEWLAAGHVLKIYRQLLNIATERQKIIKRKVAVGSVPRINLIENEQNILRRKAALNEAIGFFKKKSNDVSLYYRDDIGNGIIPNEDNLPKVFEVSIKNGNAVSVDDVMDIINKRPEIGFLDTSLEREELKLLRAENNLAPRLDVMTEVSRDMGSGPNSLDDTEVLIGFRVSVPLERNLGEGQLMAAKAKIRSLQQDRILAEDKIRIEVENVLLDMSFFKKVLDINISETSLAKQMVKAEIRLFENGASNLFLVNNREERSAETAIKVILAKEKLYKAHAQYLASTVQWSYFGLESGL